MWQARRDLNPQHPDLESDALPLELLACKGTTQATKHLRDPMITYFVSLWGVCFRQNGQYLLNASLSGVVRLFLVVE
jgi:hypothetical protein